MDPEVLEYSRGTRDERSERRGFFWARVSLACAAAGIALYLSARETPRVFVGFTSLGCVLAAVVTGAMGSYFAPRTRLGRVALLVAAVCAVGIGADVLTPSFGHPRGPYGRLKCASNLRQIGQGVLLYSNDNGGAYPPTLGLLIPMADINPEVMTCPGSNETRVPETRPVDQAAALDGSPHLHSSYVYVGATLSAKSPAASVVAYERRHTHHDERGMNVLFNDGSVRWVGESEAKHIEAELAAGRNPPLKYTGRP